ncbi:Uu.00g080460.m01.CDS01 [Anthostomella pinea]|uniref:Uu.00g080460.m01.CDS01 n=1 Tax=Anthostomella pinea TaxID=933095 RepID=A0AAI8VKZ9_9PEZI|nr:Uu.00g080460.m01.CDS01 [Anthostomella pinea]
MEESRLIPFGPDATCTLDTCPLEWSVLQYRPSLATNVTFICIYFNLMCIHLWLGIRWKSWWFTGCVVVGTAYNIIGYGGRIMLYQNPFSFNGFLLQIICVGSAPVFYSAAIYVTMKQIVVNLDPSISRLRPNLYYIIFIICDVGALVLQAVGGALSTTTKGSSNVAVDISLVGLSFQVFTTCCFCSLLAEYLIRYFKTKKPPGGSSGSGSVGTRLKLFLCFLGFAVLLILARCAYRVAELNQGYTGGLIHDQPLFIGLEGVLIVLAVSSLCIGHPGFVFKPSGRGLKGLPGNHVEEHGDVMLADRKSPSSDQPRPFV